MHKVSLEHHVTPESKGTKDPYNKDSDTSEASWQTDTRRAPDSSTSSKEAEGEGNPEFKTERKHQSKNLLTLSNLKKF